jgi:hypothetical protein
MDKSLIELKERIPDQHKDLVKYTEHIFGAIDQYVEEHRRLVALEAIAGIKPSGIMEKGFYEQMLEFKKILIKELSKTVEDIEHKGDKNWNKNYKDGI